ncbi:MAG: DUF3810 domain-containing protein [Eubacteriales bacterium]|nr:DUF3810 domain-containing protein [Eubacteriales bacterium]
MNTKRTHQEISPPQDISEDTEKLSARAVSCDKCTDTPDAEAGPGPTPPPESNEKVAMQNDNTAALPPPAVIYRLPLVCKILFALAGVSAVIYLIAMQSTAFADWWSRYPGATVRSVLAHLTNWLPCSLAEALVLFLPVILFFLIRTAIKKYSDCWHNTLVYLGMLLSVASLLFTLMVWGFGTGYYGQTLDKKLGLERRDVSAEELKYTAEQLVEEVNRTAEQVTFRNENFSVMPYSINEMNDKLLEAYDKVSDKYDFVQRLNSRVKPVVNSELWSYTHITGVYSYFTGEANINVNFPDYTIVFTAAHELAHQRGIAREDEANFMAFLVCTASDDPYIQYCGYLNMYEYVRNSLYSASADMYKDVNDRLSLNVKYELYSYSKFFDKYRKNVVANVSEVVNDTYLKIQGTPGTKSYGMVTDLAVAYYRSIKP